MSPIAKTTIGILLVGIGNIIWIDYAGAGAWTLSGLVLCAIGGGMLGTVVAEAYLK